MKSRLRSVGVASLLALALAATPAFTHAADSGPERMENFRLIDQTDRSHELYDYADAEAVVLYVQGNGCPIVRQSVPKVERLREAFSDKGVQFLMINANAQDTREDVAQEAADFDIETPILMDNSQQITKPLGVERTAEAIVADPQNDWKIIYRGAVDDRFDYGARRDTASEEWLKDALEAHLAGEPVPKPRTKTKGCLINYLDNEKLSYAEDIAPILVEKCATCHRKGGVGPFALSNYRKVKGWAAMIREVIRTDRMPPWHADGHYARLEGSMDLTTDQKRKLLSWLDDGAPRGDGPTDPLEAVVPPAADTEWTFGEPDLVLNIPEQEIPAEGIIDYRYLYADTGLEEDKWVRAIEVKPTNQAVVHHALVFPVYPRRYRHIQPDVHSGLNGYFGAYLPGGELQPLPEGTGQFVPAGTTFVFQMHYNATGRVEKDATEMALYFHDEPPEEALVIEAAAETDFNIPPHAKDHPVRAAHKFKKDVRIWGFSPHMHYRGSRARFIAEYPDGGSETLLNVPWYEFDWQPLYTLEKPLEIPAGTRMICRGAFDNSRFNPRNPNPDRWVGFGEQSFDEMFIGYVAYSFPRDDEYFAPKKVEAVGDGTELTAENLVGTKWHLMRKVDITFKEGGEIFVNKALKGDYTIEGDTVYVSSPIRDITLKMAGDELLFRTRALRRLM